MLMRILGLLTRKGRLRFKRYRKILSTLAFAVVLGSLVIGSAIIVHSRIPPLWKEVPVIGITGFIVSGMIGFVLLIKIIRNRGL
jgi:ubiquinone biosynthesis protein